MTRWTTALACLLLLSSCLPVHEAGVGCDHDVCPVGGSGGAGGAGGTAIDGLRDGGDGGPSRALGAGGRA